MSIYLDHSATTPPAPEVVQAVQFLLTQNWGNPASLHGYGTRAAFALETARQQVAQLLSSPNPDSIVFTSGGTEANHLALWGITRQYSQPQHLIISQVEHSAISAPVAWLAQQGWQVTSLKVDRWGRVNPEDLVATIQPNTALISIIYGQSEIGTLQPIEALGKIARGHHIPFHTDAVQVAGRCSIDVQKLPVDLLSLSSHKFYGIQGAGALYVNPDLGILPLLMGGGQENGLRSGTPTLPAIVGMGVAAKVAAKNMSNEVARLQALRDYGFERLQHCPQLRPTGDRLFRLPHHLSFVIEQPSSEKPLITGKQLVRALDKQEIAISAGSACHSGKLTPSPVLTALGFDHAQAQTGIRLTLGQSTTQADIDAAVTAIEQFFAQCCSPEKSAVI